MKSYATIVWIFTLIFSGTGSVWAGGVPDSQGASGTDASAPWESAADVDLKDPDRIAAGEMTFQSTCADYCHGREPALFINRDDLDPVQAFKTIYEGGKGATPMPPWGGILTDGEIWELVAYIKYLGTTE
ncbi:c-type cytochrome [Marinobacter sp.]|uniref:c-type cytochrome n=1 Tax=Marinobacter sp. TaxID=50741 RepID=UPI003BAA2CDB